MTGEKTVNTLFSCYIVRMRIVLLGAGEAFDETLGNTCALVFAESRVLLDCGYAAPFQVWSYDASPNLLDAIYVSHGHADHYFGLPALLTRMAEEKRSKPLTIISQGQVIAQIRQLLELGYAGVTKRLPFAIDAVEVSPQHPTPYRDFEMRFAPTLHSVSNLAVRMETAGAAFCYSGDGMFTPESRALFSGAGLLLHEAYMFEESPVHADIPRLIQMAEDAKVQHLVLTHVQRTVRKEEPRLNSLKSGVRLTLATPGASFDVPQGV